MVEENEKNPWNKQTNKWIKSTSWLHSTVFIESLRWIICWAVVKWSRSVTHLHRHIMSTRDWLCLVAHRWKCLYSHWVYRRFYPPSQQPHGYRGQILLFQFHTRGSCQLKAMEQWSIGHRGPIHRRTRGPASLLTPDSGKHTSAHNGLAQIVLIKPRAFSVILINLYFYFSLTPRL